MPGLLDTQTLLSPQEEGFARSQGLMNAAAALMKGARWSVIPVSPFEALGDGLQGYTSGYNSAADQLLKRETLRSTIDQRRLAALQMIGQYAGLGIKPPPLLTQMAGGPAAVGNFGDVSGGGAVPAPGLPAPGSGMPAAAATPKPVGPGAPPAALPGGLLSPTLVGNAAPLSGGTAAPAASPSPAPAGGGVAIPDVANIVRTLPLQTRYSLATKSPAGDIVKGVIEKTLTPTEQQKNATASGESSPENYEVSVANRKLAEKQKEAAAAGYPNVADYEAALAARKGVADARGKYIGTIIQGVQPARETINTLNVMEDALDRAGDKIHTGPYANDWLKLKQAAHDLGFQVDGLPEAEVVSKLNAYLAGQATKAISSRPAQFEFQTYLKNNPGLLTSVEGTKKLIDVLRQQSMQHVKLGKLAMDDSNIKNWGDVEEKFYKDNPIVSPFTGKPLGTAAGGGNAPAATTKYLKTATNPKTGAKLGLDPATNTWVPIQ